tara:strand:+ start:112 stop:477 length:366 start_codon:yes stop_codon:yes gene_type:complete
MGRIVVRDLYSYAYHGCLDAEKKIGGHYKTTLWVEGDFSKSEKTDLLKDAVDYETLGLIVQEQMKISSNLIEHVAHRILNEIEIRLSNYDLLNVGIKVVKINPPVKGDVPQVEYIKEKKYK